MTVTFTSPYGSLSESVLGFKIDFGDGLWQTVTCSHTDTTVTCDIPVEIKHIYKMPGTYTATLYMGKLLETDQIWVAKIEVLGQ